MPFCCFTNLIFTKQEKNKVFCQITPELKKLISDFKRPLDMAPSQKFNKIYVDNGIVKLTVPKIFENPEIGKKYSCKVSLEMYDFISEGKRLVGLYFLLDGMCITTDSGYNNFPSPKKPIADFTKVEQNYDLNFPVQPEQLRQDEPIQN